MEWLWLIILLGVYFFPIWVAILREHHAQLALFVTNLLCGWFFLGWVFALAWACRPVNKEWKEAQA